MFLVDAFILDVEYLNYASRPVFAASAAAVAPYSEALENARRSGQVYWVDWPHRDSRPGFPLKTLFDRWLNAVRDGQTVPQDEDAPVD